MALVFGPAAGQECAGQNALRGGEGLEFQAQELIPSRSGAWIFPLASPPRLVWRDAQRVSQLGGPVNPEVRWFDASLRESKLPDHPGRWMAWVEGTAPNSRPFRRSFTFFALPDKIEPKGLPDLTIEFPRFPADDTPDFLREYEAEIRHSSKDVFTRALLDSERVAILLSAIYESQPLGRPRRFAESSMAAHAAAQLALKQRLLGGSQASRPLDPPFSISQPAPPLSQESIDAFRAQDDRAKEQIDAFCHRWAQATGEPFVTMIISNDRVITHEAYGESSQGEPIGLDYRCWTASLTKTVTGLMFARFVDQGRIGLDDSLATVFPDYPKDDPHVPTFRQCLNHTAGFEGLADFGGMNHPHLENVVLNAIELNQPGLSYRYSGMGFELAAKAMEMVSGMPAAVLYDQQLFQPLGFGDVVLGNASSDAELTASELASLGQLLLGRGRCRGLEFFRSDTFEALLPLPLAVADAPAHGYGVGLHRIEHRRPASPPGSQQAGPLIFSPRTIGHGSFSGCILVVDMERRWIIAQARRQFRDQDNPWFQEFFGVVADALAEP